MEAAAGDGDEVAVEVGEAVVVADCRMESMENAVAAALNTGTSENAIWLLRRCKTS